MARLLSPSNEMTGIDEGITFISTNKQVTSQTEVMEFIQRCVANIQESPESMQAGLSCLLLKAIAVASSGLQEVVGRYVYLAIVDQVINQEVKIVNQVAYLTVLISLT